MKVYLLVVFTTITVLFSSGCSSIGTDQHIRISGIIDACKSNPQNRKEYLQQKVQKKEISETVSFTIEECLKNE